MLVASTTCEKGEREEVDGGKRDWSWERGRRGKGEKGEKMGGRREGEKESEGAVERRKGRGIGKGKRGEAGERPENEAIPF